MAIPIQVSFEVPASIGHARAYFSDPFQVATCLPDACRIKCWLQVKSQSAEEVMSFHKTFQ